MELVRNCQIISMIRKNSSKVLIHKKNYLTTMSIEQIEFKLLPNLQKA